MGEHEVAWSTGTTRAAVRSLALLYLFGGLACLLGAAFPMDRATPRVLLVAFGTVGLSGAALLWLLQNHPRRWLIHLFVSTGAVLACVLVHCAATIAGAVVTSFDLPFIGIYVAYFMSRFAARSHVVFASALFTFAWFTRTSATPVVPWVVVVVSVVATTEVLSKLMTQLQRSAVADDLTGLLNRNGLRPSLDREIARARRARRPLALVVIDVDGLKQVNDILGHASGDRLLTDVAAAWTGVLRKEDLLARVGGDEFILVLPDTTTDRAGEVIDRLRGVRGPARGTRWSAGVAALREGECADDLIDRADRRMYAAKRAGRAVEIGT